MAINVQMPLEMVGLNVSVIIIDTKNIFHPERNASYTHLNIVSNQAAISGQHNFINMFLTSKGLPLRSRF